MNMMKLRQILEMRRANKAPPLIPPKPKRASDAERSKRGPKEIIDVRVNLRNFNPGQKSKSNTIVMIFSESEDSVEQGWKATTSTDLLEKKDHYDLHSVFSVEFQFERPQYIKLDVCDWREYNAVSLGYTIFAVSELVTQRDGSIVRDIVDDESGQTVANVLISSSLRPKPHSILLQFHAKNIQPRKNIMPNSAQVFFEVHKSDADKLVLYRSECTKYATKILFKTFSLQSTDIMNNVVDIMCFYRDSKNPKIFIGSFPATYDQLSRAQTQPNSYTLTYETSKNQRKVCGEFELLKFNEMILPSFLEFISNGTAINVAFAVDLTQAEIVDVELVQQYVNDVELAIKAIGEPLRDFNASSSYLSFGFGAKIPPHYRESQEFCLNLGTDPHVRGVDGVLDAFRTAFANTKPLNTGHLSNIIYYVSKLAKNASSKSKTALYYVLIVITRGVFDDIKETVQSLIFASRAPISVVFVGVGEMDFSELERLGAAGMRLNYHGRKPERDCVKSVSIPKCRNEETNPSELRALIAERALSQIPWQLSTCMSRHEIKPVTTDMPQTLQHEMYTTMEYSWQPIQSASETPSVYSLSEASINESVLDESLVHSQSSNSEERPTFERPKSRQSTSSRSHSIRKPNFVNNAMGSTSGAVNYGNTPHQNYNHQRLAYEQQMAFEQIESAESDSLKSIASVEFKQVKSVPHTFHSDSVNYHSHHVHPNSRQGNRY